MVPKSYNMDSACTNFKNIINSRAGSDSHYEISCRACAGYSHPVVIPDSGDETDCGYFIDRLNSIVNQQPGGSGVNLKCVSDKADGDRTSYGLLYTDPGAEDYCNK